MAEQYFAPELETSQFQYSFDLAWYDKLDIQVNKRSVSLLCMDSIVEMSFLNERR